MKLVLFDIDGTLMDSGGAGTKSMDLAFEELFSVRNAFQGIAMAGKTDIQIMKEGLRKHGLDSENGQVGRLCESYVRHLRVLIENPRKRLKPFIRETLSSLSRMDEVRLGLLTGNLKAGARVKLSPFGLNEFFPFGAFGDDDEDRNKLLPVAVDRFNRRNGRKIEYGECIVIGDTPRDVECAKVCGAYSVAVATGPYSFDSLVAAGADVVLNTMGDMDYSIF
jgi:phosphoglycolate phosphatase